MNLQPLRFQPPDRPVDDPDGTSGKGDGFRTDADELSYHVEVWDEAGAALLQVVATSVNPSIGYAAFYAATREFPARSIILRHRGRVISRWAARPH